MRSPRAGPSVSNWPLVFTEPLMPIDPALAVHVCAAPRAMLLLMKWNLLSLFVIPPLPIVSVLPWMENAEAPGTALKVIERMLQAESASASSRSEPVKTRSAVPLLGGALSPAQLLSRLHCDPSMASPLQVKVAA